MDKFLPDGVNPLELNPILLIILFLLALFFGVA